MTKIDIFSGFLGAGKTTLIKKLIREAYAGEKLVLIENEFGEIGIDGGFLADAGIRINELNSGCICCSLVGDFAEALKKVYEEYHPDRILIEPSGVGKLSDVIRAVQSAKLTDCVVNSATAVVDANKCKMYMKNFGEFFNDQIETAACIVFSHADVATESKLATALSLVREHNPEATVVTTAWDKLDGKDILASMEHADTLAEELKHLAEEHHHHHEEEEEEHEHHHHHHEDGEECCCGHHHHDDDDDDDDEHECHHHHHEEEHEHHEHHYDENGVCSCGHHHDEDEHEHHHHEHGEECGCGHHHHHHADEVFTSWGVETSKKFTVEEITSALKSLTNAVQFGTILRAKGIVEGQNGEWIHFDYVPGEPDVRLGCPATIGRLCVIGSKPDQDELKELFGV